MSLETTNQTSLAEQSKQKSKKVNQKPYVAKIIVEHVLDECPDLSYLEQDYSDCTPEDNERYKAEDRKRLEDYNNGYWHMMGIGAKAYINLEGIYDNMIFSTEISSMYLWGIESDSDKECIQEVENQELDCIKEQLKRLKIKIPKNLEIEHVERGF